VTPASGLAIFRILGVPALAAGLAGTASGQAPPVPHARVSLVAESLAVTRGQILHVALRQEIQPGWHSYWVNPGDSGLATAIDWKLPPGFAADPIGWPIPERFRAGTLVNYGYEGDVLLPITITVPTTLDPGSAVTLAGHASWLACSEICVPGEADVTLTLPVATGPAARDPQWADRLQSVRAALPAEAQDPATLTVGRDSVELHLALAGADRLRDIVFFPVADGIIDNDADQRVETAPNGMTITLVRGELKASPLDRLAGILVFRDKGIEGGARRRAIAISVPTAP